MDTIAIFSSFVEAHKYLGYAALFLGMILEGEVILMASGILVNINALDLEKVFFVAFLGVLANDVFWYYLGSHIKNKYYKKKIIMWAEAKVRKILPHIENNPAKAIFISKFIAGINHPTLVVLGFLKIDFFYFLKHQLWASFLWTLTFLFLGVLFGYTAISYSRRFEEFILTAIFLIAGVMIIERLTRFLIRKNG